jgi:hypothetical protein
MNADIFAEWLRRQGYRVVRTSSSHWYEAGPRVYQAFPYHREIDPPEEELLELLCAHRAIALRYSTPLLASQGKISYHVVYEGSSFDLATLPRQARQNTCKGLNYAQIEPIPLARLASEGWALRLESLARQGRTHAESEAWWRRVCLSAQDLPGFEAWGAIHNGELVASFLAFTCDNCYTLPYEQSATSHLEYRVNNAIFYSVTHIALERPGISKVFLCLQSLDAPTSVDEFKFRMGYTPYPVRQRVVFHPWLAAALNQGSYALVKQLVGWFAYNPALPKIEGMLRFCLEGKCSLSEQTWPSCLTPRKQELLETFS